MKATGSVQWHAVILCAGTIATTSTHGPREAEAIPVPLGKKKIGFKFVNYLVFKKWKMTEQLFQSSK